MNRINLIALGVRDMAKSLAFYKDIGFKTYVTESQPAIVFFDNQGTKLELFPLDELVKDINPDQPPIVNEINKYFPGFTLAINLHSKEEVDNYMALVAQKGASIVKTPELVSWGGYSGYFQDPDGYYWEVAYSPSWEFDEKEMLVIGEE